MPDAFPIQYGDTKPVGQEPVRPNIDFNDSSQKVWAQVGNIGEQVMKIGVQRKQNEDAIAQSLAQSSLDKLENDAVDDLANKNFSSLDEVNSYLDSYNKTYEKTKTENGNKLSNAQRPKYEAYANVHQVSSEFKISNVLAKKKEPINEMLLGGIIDTGLKKYQQAMGAIPADPNSPDYAGSVKRVEAVRKAEMEKFDDLKRPFENVMPPNKVELAVIDGMVRAGMYDEATAYNDQAKWLDAKEKNSIDKRIATSRELRSKDGKTAREKAQLDYANLTDQVNTEANAKGWTETQRFDAQNAAYEGVKPFATTLEEQQQLFRVHNAAVNNDSLFDATAFNGLMDFIKDISSPEQVKLARAQVDNLARLGKLGNGALKAGNMETANAYLDLRDNKNLVLFTKGYLASYDSSKTAIKRNEVFAEKRVSLETELHRIYKSDIPETDKQYKAVQMTNLFKRMGSEEQGVYKKHAGFGKDLNLYSELNYSDKKRALFDLATIGRADKEESAHWGGVESQKYIYGLVKGFKNKKPSDIPDATVDKIDEAIAEGRWRIFTPMKPIYSEPEKKTVPEFAPPSAVDTNGDRIDPVSYLAQLLVYNSQQRNK